MLESTFRVRPNWLAILIASIASLVFEIIWFSIFLDRWLRGIGRTRAWLDVSGMPLPVQLLVAFLCSLVAATVLTILIQKTGPRTPKRGIAMALLVWVGFVATSWAKEYIFEVRTLEIYLVNTIYILLDLILMGAILGAWKRTSPRL